VYPLVLTIAGSDPSAGAGIQADLKTFAALEVYGTSVITTVTAQNPERVLAVQPLSVQVVTAQLSAILEWRTPAAIKIGLISSTELAATLCLSLPPEIPLVVDPVMVSSSGNRFLDDDTIATLRQAVLPRTELLTPNIDEAAALLACGASEIESDKAKACRELVSIGPAAVLLTGGSGDGEDCQDLFFDGTELVSLSAWRIATSHTHGTGCALSVAVTALRARGRPLRDAVLLAKDYISGAIREADHLNSGCPHHFFQRWDPSK